MLTLTAVYNIIELGILLLKRGKKVEDNTRKKHRERVRKAYLDGSPDSLSDAHILELVLFYSIPRKDVKPVAYNLINTFGSIENVFSASPQELMRVNGVGESTAVLLNLLDLVNQRVILNRNAAIKKLNCFDVSKRYFGNLLQGVNVEKVMVATLSAKLDIIKCHTVSAGTVTCANIEPRVIVEKALADNATSIVIAHNHPHGAYLPSESDIEFTLKLKELLAPLGVSVSDHIIVGNNGVLSMSNDVRYVQYFC